MLVGSEVADGDGEGGARLSLTAAAAAAAAFGLEIFEAAELRDPLKAEACLLRYDILCVYQMGRAGDGVWR